MFFNNINLFTIKLILRITVITHAYNVLFHSKSFKYLNCNVVASKTQVNSIITVQNLPRLKTRV